ncbi:chemokine (C-X-C motif) ligand 7, isoform CRA_a [Rattus norvegicus]|uniref:Chemokine (C-X-C motif) ligand 7, isoform CRA_a n=1 Tax=Rattus norvegicus TaxID=10116 RepID=A6KKE6_RAT|nr:chemokine (C-X-C motif) ligand 7, isoform CRA_a [Rattus norvegicus]
MGFRLRPTSSCTRASSLRNLQVLLSLLLVALVPLAVGKRKRNSGKESGGRLLPFIF